MIGFGGPKSSFGSDLEVFDDFSREIDFLIKCKQVPEGSGMFSHSSLKTLRPLRIRDGAHYHP
jgi:hypothetical protein